MNRDHSHALYGRALSVLPGGVNSPVRATQPYPSFIDHGDGSHVVDVDGNRYIDYVLGYGPILLGHSPPPKVRDAIADRVEDGIMFGAPVEAEIELAEFVVEHVPSVEMLRFVNSGTEATTAAVRLARGYTGRERILIIGGGYHGGNDAFLVDGTPEKAGRPGSPGVPSGAAKDTLVVPFNDAEAAARAFEAHGDEIAAILVEPVLGNSGCIDPVPGYLDALRQLADDYGALLVFDEVMTGFRIGGLGCAQGVFGVRPDLTTFAKVIGGGFPVGAVGGPTEILERFTPAGDVFHASTYAGHPVGMVAGVETLRYAKEHGVYGRLAELGDRLRAGLADIVADHAPQYTVVGRDSMFKIIFSRASTEPPGETCGAGCRHDPDCTRVESCPKNASHVGEAEGDRWERLFWGDMLDQGVMLTANQHESQFLSAAHTDEDIEVTLEAYKHAMSRIPTGV